MNYHPRLVTAAFLAATVWGCSKHAPPPVPPAAYSPEQLHKLVATGAVKINATHYISAAQTYIRNLKAQQFPVPSWVGIQELVSKELLKPADVAGFTAAGEEVAVSLTADYTKPEDILLKIQLPDASRQVAFVDGSVKEDSH